MPTSQYCLLPITTMLAKKQYTGDGVVYYSADKSINFNKIDFKKMKESLKSKEIEKIILKYYRMDNEGLELFITTNKIEHIELICCDIYGINGFKKLLQSKTIKLLTLKRVNIGEQEAIDYYYTQNNKKITVIIKNIYQDDYILQFSNKVVTFDL